MQVFLSTVMYLTTGSSFVKIIGPSITQNRTVFILLHLSVTMMCVPPLVPKTLSSWAPEMLHLLTFLLLCGASVPTLLCWLLLFLTSQCQQSRMQYSLSSLPTLPSQVVSPRPPQPLNTIPTMMMPRFISPVLGFPLSSRFLHPALPECLISTINLICPK